MRKKSPASIQKWVDSIDTANTVNPDHPSTSQQEVNAENQKTCDTKTDDIKEIGNTTESCSTPSDNNTEEPVQDDEASTSDNKKSLSYHENLKEMGKQKFSEIYDRINIKNKKIEFKNLLSKTSLKFKSQTETSVSNKMQTGEEETLIKHGDLEVVQEVLEEVQSRNDEIRISLEVIPELNDLTSNSKDSLNLLNVSKSQHIGVIGRSSSENPKVKKKNRLQDIGRSFSVQDNDSDKITIDSTDNLIYDIDDESTSNQSNNILFPSLNTSTKSINSNISSASQNAINNSQNNLSCNIKSVPLSPINKSDHAFSEGHSNSRKNSKGHMLRDCSFQSDSSYCSSVESLLEQRKPDAEQILINLGFGPPQTEDVLTKIPKRFLKPSQCIGVHTEKFLKQQQLAYQIHESSVLGYRGLLGNSESLSAVVSKIMERFSEHEKLKLHLALIHYYNNMTASPIQQLPKISIHNELYSLMEARK